MKIIDFLTELFHKIFNVSIAELTLIELLTGIAVVALIVILAYKLFKFIWSGIKHFARFVRVSIDAKEKCKHIQCTSCGRTLDKCVCQKNKGKSNFGRLMAYKKEKRNRG